MTKQLREVTRAERLRAVMAMPEYKDTIGAWIEEELHASQHLLETAKEPYEFHKAQGAVCSIKSLKEQFDKVFAAEQFALTRRSKQQPSEE